MTSIQEVKRRKRSYPWISSLSDETSEEQINQLEYVDFLLQKYNTCRQRNEYCDVTLKVGDTAVESHRLILAANSEYFVSRFKNHFSTEDDIITLPAEYVDESSFLKLVDAMYGAPFVIEDDLFPLFATSLYLQLTYFVNRLKDHIRFNLDKIDTIALVSMPQLQFDKSLYTLVKKHVCRNFSNLYKSGMASITLDIFSDLFSDPDLFVNSKEQLFDFAKSWISYDVENRRKHLQTVASLLKPFHTPAPEVLKLVNYLESVSPSETDIQVALNTLIEYPPIIPSNSSSNNSQGRHELLSTPLFFVQPSDESPVIFGTYRNKGWEYWNEVNQFRPPVANDLLVRKEGAVANDTIYVAGKCRPYEPGSQTKNEKDVFFHGLDVKTREWIELLTPRKTPSCLVSCDSKVYAYDSFPLEEGYHISVFESVLNRWFRIPSVHYQRKFAGITSSDRVLYMVGGVPTSHIDSANPVNIIEFYDSRRGSWTRISVPEVCTIFNSSRYTKRVCFMNDVLYIADEDDAKLHGLDLRNNKFLDMGTTISVPIKYLIRVGRTLWNIGSANDEIEIISSKGDLMDSITNLNTMLEPISMPYY